MSNLSIVTFHGQPVYAVEIEGKPYVAMKPICENIGIAWNGQFERIKRNTVLNEGIRVIRTPSSGGDQNTLCLPLDMLNGWLFGVDASRVNPDIKDRLIRYQRECYSVLFQHFSKPKTEPTPTPFTRRPLDPNVPMLPVQAASRIVEENLAIGSLFGAPLHLVQSEAVKTAYNATGYSFDNMLRLAPAQQNIHEDEEMLEPRDLAKRLGVGGSGASINKLLEGAGWQCKIDDRWTATDSGNPHCFRHHWKKGEKSGYNYKWRVSDVKTLLDQARATAE